MAVVNPTIERNGDGSVITFTYANMANTDTGAPIKHTQWADRTVHVEIGTLGVGGNLQWQGNNDPALTATWSALTDPQGGALDFAVEKVEQVSEMTLYQRPEITGGDGTTDITCIVTIRRQQQIRV